MNDREMPEFHEVITGVYGFYRVALTEYAVSVWWMALKNYDLPAVRDALGRHLVNPDTGQFLPKPADVVRMMQGTTVDSSMVAWSKVDRAVRSIGPYQSVCFDDPLINRVIADMGGWIDFGNCDEEREYPFRAKEFQTRYRGYKASSSMPDYPRRLTGIAEAENSMAGRAIPDAVLIGEPERALLVYRRGGEAKSVTATMLSHVIERAKALPDKGQEDAQG